MRRICVVVGSRANYSSIKSALVAIDAHKELELQLVLGASALLDRYGDVSELIKQDGFVPVSEVFMLVEGENPTTMAKSTGIGIIELSSVFFNLKPDVVVTIGDRFETMATTISAAYMNIPLAHTMGGEVTGTIDESIRHAVTKFSQIHFPASKGAMERILRLGEDPNTVHLVGCPRIDLVAEYLSENDHKPFDLATEGVGQFIDLNKQFVIVSQHPVTTEYGSGEQQVTTTLEAVEEVGLPAIVLWPNADAGSDDIARGVRKWREHGYSGQMHFVKNIPIKQYISLMKSAACLVGNSSSGIREGAFIGTPTVNIGTRQRGRERGENVIDVSHNKTEIVNAIRRQVDNGHYPCQMLYGEGRAGVKIAEILSTCALYVQKINTY